MNSIDEIRSNLKTLEILHYVYAGMCCFFGLIPIIHIVIGVLIVNGAFQGPGHVNVPPQFIGYLFIVMGSVFICFAQAMGILSFISARKINKCEGRQFSMVVAGINCAAVPLGTALGVFTFMLMGKPEVKALYDQGRSP